jgi:hypothetical protein
MRDVGRTRFGLTPECTPRNDDDDDDDDDDTNNLVRNVKENYQ